MSLDLLQACRNARQAGKDFPTIWREVLQPHPLVVDLPRHDIVAGKARILIRLGNGMTIVSSTDGFDLY